VSSASSFSCCPSPSPSLPHSLSTAPVTDTLLLYSFPPSTPEPDLVILTCEGWHENRMLAASIRRVGLVGLPRHAVSVPLSVLRHHVTAEAVPQAAGVQSPNNKHRGSSRFFIPSAERSFASEATDASLGCPTTVASLLNPYPLRNKRRQPRRTICPDVDSVKWLNAV
jgi:hypothetical protein